MPNSILLISSEGDLVNSLESQLTQLGTHTRRMGDGDDITSHLSLEAFDVIFYVAKAFGAADALRCAELRAQSGGIWIVVITQTQFHAAQADCLSNGADLVLLAPIPLGLIRSVLQLVARRLGGGPSPQPGSAPVTLNLRTMEMRATTEMVVLNEAEVRMVAALAGAPSRSVEYWQLLEAAKLSADKVSRGALEIRLSRLRNKLRNIGMPAGCLQVVRGFGYRLTVPIEVLK